MLLTTDDFRPCSPWMSSNESPLLNHQEWEFIKHGDRTSRNAGIGMQTWDLRRYSSHHSLFTNSHEWWSSAAILCVFIKICRSSALNHGNCLMPRGPSLTATTFVTSKEIDRVQFTSLYHYLSSSVAVVLSFWWFQKCFCSCTISRLSPGVIKVEGDPIFSGDCDMLDSVGYQ